MTCGWAHRTYTSYFHTLQLLRRKSGPYLAMHLMCRHLWVSSTPSACSYAEACLGWVSIWLSGMTVAALLVPWAYSITYAKMLHGHTSNTVLISPHALSRAKGYLQQADRMVGWNGSHEHAFGLCDSATCTTSRRYYSELHFGIHPVWHSDMPSFSVGQDIHLNVFQWKDVHVTWPSIKLRYVFFFLLNWQPADTAMSNTVTLPLVWNRKIDQSFSSTCECSTARPWHMKLCFKKFHNLCITLSRMNL